MQSNQDTLDAEASKRYGHRRTPTLGKAMPVTSLLLHCPPPTMSVLRSNCMRDGCTPDEEQPPLFFQLETNPTSGTLPAQLDTYAIKSIVNLKNDDSHSSSDELNIEQEYDLLVSECSSRNGGDGGDRPRRGESGISLVGNSIFYTPCLTCTDRVPDDIGASATAINEMCRRLCTDECRLRLSLAGFEPPSTMTLKSRVALAEYVNETCLVQQPQPQSQQQHTFSSQDTNKMQPPMVGALQDNQQSQHQHQQSEDEVDRVGVRSELKLITRNEPELVMSVKTKPPAVQHPPSCIAIQRKKFLTDILMANTNDTDSDSSFADEHKEIVDAMRKLQLKADKASSANESMVLEKTPTTTTTTPPPTPDSEHSYERDDLYDDDKTTDIPKIDQNKLTMLKDFYEKFEIAEALAKTSAMTSTSQMKQRLAARQLEITSANSHAKAAAIKEAAALATGEITANAYDIANECMSIKQKQEKMKQEKRRRKIQQKRLSRQQNKLQKGVSANCAPSTDALTHRNNNINTDNETESVCNEGVDSCDDEYVDDDNYSASDSDSDNDNEFGITGVDTEATFKQHQQQQQSNVNILSEYEPPRDLLLYLVRMGSFNSAPKINNVDSQDDSLEIPKGLNTNELLQHVKHLRGIHQPQLLTRYFVKPSLANDVTDGMRSLKLNTVARDYSMASTLPNHIRVLQWNILSQTLGQNNDGFVRCPEEALTWDNRKFLIVQEILQNNPDVVCLQEVDHFKFLQNILGTQNYEGIFFPKPDSPCLYIEENNGPDGCAIFYKRDKFVLKSFDTRILEVWHVQSNQVAIVVNLAVKATGKEFVVCTTHLKARTGALLSKLRNEQGRDLLRFVKKFAGQRPVLICGDFNAEPTEPVYGTVLSGELMKLSSAYADIKAERDECNNDYVDDLKIDGELVDNSTERLETVQMKEDDKVTDNVCNNNVIKSIQREPPYTTWKIREDGEECHTIDYVFYSPDQLKIRNCLEFPQDDEVGKNRTPSFQYPSDHFSLVCEFEIIDKQ